MSWKDLVCLVVIVTGAILFLYGANYYEPWTGWAGVYLVILGLTVKLLLMVWEYLKRSRSSDSSTG